MRLGELLRKTVNVVKVAVTLVLVLLFKLVLIKRLVIKMLAVGLEHHWLFSSSSSLDAHYIIFYISTHTALSEKKGKGRLYAPSCFSMALTEGVGF